MNGTSALCVHRQCLKKSLRIGFPFQSEQVAPLEQLLKVFLPYVWA